MNSVKLDKSKQKKVSGLSKAISIIALIGKIGIYIATPFVVLLMIFAPLLLNKIEVKENKFVINNDVSIEMIEDEKGLTLKYNDEEVLIEEDVDKIIEFKDILENNSKGKIIAYVELMFLTALIGLVLSYFVLRNLQKLFKNIGEKETPFTLENVKHIKTMAYLLIACIVAPIVTSSIAQLIFEKELNVNFSGVTVMEILFLFALSYIFEYGYNLQLDSNSKMYGKENE